MPVLTFWGADPVPLPARFARMKQGLVAGHEAALEASWTRLLAALAREVEHIDGLGAHLVPSVEYGDLEDPAQAARFGRDLRRYGVGVIRGVMPRPEAEAAVQETVRYFGESGAGGGGGLRPPPLPQDPTCFDYFWTPAQVRARAHPNVLRAQRFIMGLWAGGGSGGGRDIAPRLPIAYADRLRIHGSLVPGHGDGEPGRRLPLAAAAATGAGAGAPARPADDWLAALQSSCVIAQVDNGSLERWEPDGYRQRAGPYAAVFAGAWEDHDPWECRTRAAATTDLYNGYGSCSTFRMFQGVIALTTIEPGIIRLLPSPKLATAYFLLRPFFRPRSPPPPCPSTSSFSSPDATDAAAAAFLAPDNWELAPEQDTVVHGAVPGHAQRVTELWHPHLQLRRSLIQLPTLRPGDYIFWHPDVAYHITAPPSTADDNAALGMMVYLPAAPLTQTNALYLIRQRKAFARGRPGPDFDSSPGAGGGLGTGAETVSPPAGCPSGESEIAEIGGIEALRAMGLAPWEDEGGGGDADRTDDGDGTIDRGGEAELVRLANRILFPDRFGVGGSAGGKGAR